jgi:anthranilate synthase/aminodeoxychorismate synthase-like glutamine amidotransferase
MVLLVDNYDSFVHNLARYVRRLGLETQVARNDSLDVNAVRGLSPGAVILSPGPCSPRDAGCSLDLVRELENKIPILGVCLGHQAIGEGLGGRVVRAAEPMHGRPSWVHHDGAGEFTGMPNPFRAGRYHSLVIEPRSIPPTLRVTAWTEDGTVMGVRHACRPLVGWQFHPESILTEGGYRLLAGFFRLAGLPTRPDLPAECDEWRQKRRELPSLPAGPVTF